MGVEVRILGPLQVLRDGCDVTPAAGKQRAVLAALVLAAGRSVSVERLIDAVWGESPVSSARKTVQVYVGRLRSSLGYGVIVAVGAGYRFGTETAEVDLTAFDAAVERAGTARRNGETEAEIRVLRDALSLWRGEPLADVPSEALRRRAMTPLAERRSQMIERCCELEVERGRADDAVVELRALVDEHPLRERTWAALMRALYASGRAADALEAYREMARELADQLGVDPSAELRSTHQAILTQTLDAPPGRETAPSAALAAVPAWEVPRQLPAPPQSFTGRESDLAGLDGAHDTDALVISVIDGMAGIGKTALAVQAAHRMVGRYPDGQIFLDLHGHTRGRTPVEPGDALERLLRTLGYYGERIPAGAEERAALYRSRLAGRRLLIVLDNAAAEDQVLPLLPGTSGCGVLITSRRNLAGMDCTHAVTLGVLPSADAVRLFLHAAGEKRLRDGPSPATVVELCGRLPLAIRLAAARLASHPSWTVAHLADRLRGHRRRLAELEAGQRSLTSALDLSYGSLHEGAQRLYRLLGLYPGDAVDTYAAAALAGTDLASAGRLLDRLLEDHLLHEAEPGRYMFHDLTRVHAAETVQATETEASRRRALDRLLHYYRVAAAAAMDSVYPYERERRPCVAPAGTPVPQVTDSVVAAAWLDSELANLLAAVRNAAAYGWSGCLRDLTGILHRHLRARGRFPEGEALQQQALAAARAEQDSGGELRALHAMGQLHWRQGQVKQTVTRDEDR